MALTAWSCERTKGRYAYLAHMLESTTGKPFQFVMECMVTATDKLSAKIESDATTSEMLRKRHSNYIRILSKAPCDVCITVQTAVTIMTMLDGMCCEIDWDHIENDYPYCDWSNENVPYNIEIWSKILWSYICRLTRQAKQSNLEYDEHINYICEIYNALVINHGWFSLLVRTLKARVGYDRSVKRFITFLSNKITADPDACVGLNVHQIDKILLLAWSSLYNPLVEEVIAQLNRERYRPLLHHNDTSC